MPHKVTAARSLAPRVGDASSITEKPTCDFKDCVKPTLFGLLLMGISEILQATRCHFAFSNPSFGIRSLLMGR